MSVIGQIIGGGLSTITGGMSNIYKWGAIVAIVMLVVVGAFFTGWHYKGKFDIEATQAAIIKQEKKDLAISQANDKTNQAAITNLGTQVDTLLDNNTTLQNQIEALTSAKLGIVVIPAKQSNGSLGPTTCELSPDFLSIYNKSLGGAK
ncbi:MAG: hypothetical protein ACREQ5_14350 [Candidatus Dormibacteria bacterium]